MQKCGLSAAAQGGKCGYFDSRKISIRNPEVCFNYYIQSFIFITAFITLSLYHPSSPHHHITTSPHHPFHHSFNTTFITTPTCSAYLTTWLPARPEHNRKLRKQQSPPLHQWNLQPRRVSLKTSKLRHQEKSPPKFRQPWKARPKTNPLRRISELSHLLEKLLPKLRL